MYIRFTPHSQQNLAQSTGYLVPHSWQNLVLVVEKFISFSFFTSFLEIQLSAFWTFFLFIPIPEGGFLSELCETMPLGFMFPSEGGLVKPEEVFRNGEYPDDTLLTEPVDEVLLLGIPVPAPCP